MVDKIGYTRPPLAARPTRRTSSVSASGFSDALSHASEVSDTADISPNVAVSNASLLGFQEVNDQEMERRKAFKHGRQTLEALSHLRDALLMGTVPLSTLERLEKMVHHERAHTLDPALSAILDEIELRAAVEVAKLEMVRTHG